MSPRSTLLTLVLLLAAAISASAQLPPPADWHRWTFGVGGFSPVGAGIQSKTIGGSPMLSFDYGYHFHRFAQADLGVDLGFADRSLRIPRFGYRAIIPLLRDRVEASLGAGAGYSFVKPPLGGYEHWLVYGQAGANYALDLDKRYRAGLMIRWYRDPIGRPLMQWVTVGAEFTFSQ